MSRGCSGAVSESDQRQIDRWLAELRPREELGERRFGVVDRRNDGLRRRAPSILDELHPSSMDRNSSLPTCCATLVDRGRRGPPAPAVLDRRRASQHVPPEARPDVDLARTWLFGFFSHDIMSMPPNEQLCLEGLERRQHVGHGGDVARRVSQVRTDPRGCHWPRRRK